MLVEVPATLASNGQESVAARATTSDANTRSLQYIVVIAASSSVLTEVSLNLMCCRENACQDIANDCTLSSAMIFDD